MHGTQHSEVVLVNSMTAYRGSICTAPIIINLGTRCVSGQLHAPLTSPTLSRYPPNRRLGQPQSQSRHSGGNKNLMTLPSSLLPTLHQIQTSVIRKHNKINYRCNADFMTEMLRLMDKKMCRDLKSDNAPLRLQLLFRQIPFLLSVYQ